MPRHDAFKHLGFAVFRRTPAGDFYVRKGRLFRSLETPVREQARVAVEALQAEAFTRRIHGERAVRTFAEALASFLKTKSVIPDRDRRLLDRLFGYFATARLIDIDQAAVDRACEALVSPDAVPATRLRAVIAPLTTILNHAARRGWCAPPMFERPKPSRPRTDWLPPAEAQRLIAAASPHLAPLLVFLLCTGCRVGEAIALQWDDVDLAGGTVNFRDTKSGYDRKGVHLPPKAIVVLANLAHRDGAVFRRPGPWRRLADGGAVQLLGEAYESESGQFKTGWAGAMRRAGLIAWEAAGAVRTDADGPFTPVRWRPRMSPHALRHSWASWYYAATKDPLKLMVEGGWRSLDLVERYTHLMPTDMGASIAAIWGVAKPAQFPAAKRARSGAERVQPPQVEPKRKARSTL